MKFSLMLHRAKFILFQLLVWADQGFNVIAGGYADETLSARAYREQLKAEKYIDTLFFWQDRHCYNAYLSEMNRKQLPLEYRPK